MSRENHEWVITPVQQVDDSTCAHACLSMVTGVPIQAIRELLGPQEHGLVTTQELAVLAKYGFVGIEMTTTDQWRYGVYLLTVPSQNRLGLNHRVVVDYREAEPVLMDPQSGREGRKAYTTADFIKGKMGWSEPLLVVPVHDLYNPDWGK